METFIEVVAWIVGLSVIGFVGYKGWKFLNREIPEHGEPGSGGPATDDDPKAPPHHDPPNA